MALKDILDKILNKLPADAGDELTALLADAKREANTVLSDLSAANNESKDRRLKLTETQTELDALKAKYADATKPNAELDSLKQKAALYDELQSKQATELVTGWKTKAEELAKIAASDTDKRKAKVASIMADFETPAEGAEITPEMASANLKLYAALDKAGAFAVPETPGTDFQRKSTDATGNPPAYRNSGEAMAARIYNK